MPAYSVTTDIILYIVALIVPPFPVFVKTGCGPDILINILLWILGWFPGVIHAWYIIAKYDGAIYDYDRTVRF
ncbi:UPF0057-domain-containing protein [Ramaria rubella]|nr:UPF0057-domain-containing protein [Ramaria rubella]